MSIIFYLKALTDRVMLLRMGDYRMKNEELDIAQFGEGNMLQYFLKELEAVLIQVNESDSCTVCFTNSKNYNAMVRNNGNNKRLEINIGVIMLIYHLSYILMLSNTIFPEIGGSEDISDFNFFDFEFPAIESREDNFKEINFYSGPSDPLRLAIAQVIAMFGVEFVLFHELGHILGGHLEYLQERLGIIELKAHGSEHDLFIKARDSITYQTIEMDADAISIHLLLENVLCKKKQIVNAFLYGHEIELGKLLVISIVIAFFLMNTGSKEESDKYLPRDYRFHLVVSILLSKLKGEYQSLLDDISHITDVVKIYLNCNDFLSNLFNCPKMEEIPSSELNQYYDDVIIKKWESIRNDVQKKARIKLPD